MTRLRLFLFFAVMSLLGCDKHAPGPIGGPAKLPIGDLSTYQGVDGGVPTIQGAAINWVKTASGSIVSCDGGELVMGADGGYACTSQLLMGAGGSPIIVNNGAVAYMPGGLSALNGAFSYTLTTTTTNTTPSTALSLPLSSFSNSGGNITAIVTGKVPSSATSVTQTWVGLVTDNGGTCAVMTTGGTFAATTTGSTGTVAATPVSVALSSCSIVATVTGTSATTWHWSMVVQYAMAGP